MTPSVRPQDLATKRRSGETLEASTIGPAGFRASGDLMDLGFRALGFWVYKGFRV